MPRKNLEASTSPLTLSTDAGIGGTSDRQTADNAAALPSTEGVDGTDNNSLVHHHEIDDTLPPHPSTPPPSPRGAPRQAQWNVPSKTNAPGAAGLRRRRGGGGVDRGGSGGAQEQQQQQQQQQQQTLKAATPKPKPESIDSRFGRACKLTSSSSSSGGPALSNATKLRIYALFKQASEGRCGTPKPGMFEVVKKAKWNAWSALGGMPQDEAKEQYASEIFAMYAAAQNGADGGDIGAGGAAAGAGEAKVDGAGGGGQGVRDDDDGGEQKGAIEDRAGGVNGGGRVRGRDGNGNGNGVNGLVGGVPAVAGASRGALHPREVAQRRAHAAEEAANEKIMADLEVRMMAMARRRVGTLPGTHAEPMWGALDVCLRGGSGVLRRLAGAFYLGRGGGVAVSKSDMARLQDTHDDLREQHEALREQHEVLVGQVAAQGRAFEADKERLSEAIQRARLFTDFRPLTAAWAALAQLARAVMRIQRRTPGAAQGGAAGLMLLLFFWYRRRLR